MSLQVQRQRARARERERGKSCHTFTNESNRCSNLFRLKVHLIIYHIDHNYAMNSLWIPFSPFDIVELLLLLFPNMQRYFNGKMICYVKNENELFWEQIEIFFFGFRKINGDCKWFDLLKLKLAVSFDFEKISMAFTDSILRFLANDNDLA